MKKIIGWILIVYKKKCLRNCRESEECNNHHIKSYIRKYELIFFIRK